MNAAPRVSVVVVSRDRPGPLSRCLTALTQLDYAPFEVIVAADDAGLAAVAALGLADAVKSVRVEAPGISAARNAGVAIAAGDVVAFIDDDAVAEPTWLTHLATPFAESDVEAAGGYVRGRNGISFQWRARSVNRQAVHADLPPADSTPRLLPPPPDGAIRTEGTNMAFRRETLAAMGGFDTGFRFFLDETDLNMRLAGAGALTAVVPLAQVHHGFAPSPRRNAARAPRSLREIGASTALFLRKHAPPSTHRAALQTMRAAERRRALQHMVAGSLEPRDVRRLMHGLEAGISDGMARPLADPAPIPASDRPFLPFPGHPPRAHRRLAGRIWQARRLRAEAARLAQQGHPVTLFLFSPTALYHRMRFDDAGYWEQKGGLFGRSERSGPLFRLRGFDQRLREETERLAAIRPLHLAPDTSAY